METEDEKGNDDEEPGKMKSQAAVTMIAIASPLVSLPDRPKAVTTPTAR